MHLELRTQLAQRLLAPNRLHRHSRFEGRTVLFSRRRHLLLLCLNDSPNSNLLPGLNSWDHYRDRDVCTLGISAPSPNWQDERFASILNFAAAHFRKIRIDVTDELYRHNFMAEG